MQYVSFVRNGEPRVGVRTGAGVLDLHAAAKAMDLLAPRTMEELIAAGEAGARSVEAISRTALRSGLVPLLGEDELVFLPVVSRPEKIICVGLNYRRHAEESGLPVPGAPVYFAKYANSLAGHRHEIVLPAGAEQFDYEVELAVVIGKPVHRAAEDAALDAVFGYTIANDLSARDWQMRTSQWMYGKAIDGFLPLGPWLVTADEVSDPQSLRLRCTVNGEVRQDSTTADMVFSVAQIISDISRIMTLKPGDVILTGTPEGVAMGMTPPPWLKPGDVVACEIEGLGCLVNRLVAEAGQP